MYHTPSASCSVAEHLLEIPAVRL